MKLTRTFALVGAIAATMTLTACDDDDPAATPPTAPAGVAVEVDGTDATVTWNAVANADNYEATLTSAGAANETATTSTTEVTFSGLTEGAQYTVVVRAINEDGSAVSDPVSFLVDESVVLVSSDILQNTTWTADKTWVLTQPIFVGTDCGTDGSDPDCVEATLTIEPGTTILGRSDVPQGIRGAYLVVSRGSQIIADATGDDRAPTADEVIVFTSDRPRGQRGRGDWGGLIINGQAPTNAGTEAQGEGDSGFYGGPDVDDDSGILRGVRIEFAGDDVTPTDQLNGLALQGVGAGTTISYLQIHYNTDDGIEPFGGTVSVDHLVVTGIGDDSVDGTDGYRGFMQFIVGQQRGDDADQGFELSNNGDDGDATPVSSAVVANATMIGARESVVSGEIAGAESDRGVEFREGSRYRLFNTIIAGFNTGFRINDASTVAAAQNRIDGETTPETTMWAEGIILWNNDESFEDTFAETFFETDGFNNIVADPGFDASIYDYGSLDSPPDFTVADMPAGYTAFDLSNLTYGDDLVAPVDGRTLVTTDYAGAVEPGTDLASAWYNGWTVWTTDGSDSRPNAEGN